MASAATIEFRFGWLVVPLIDAIARVGHVHAGVGRLQHATPR